MLSLLTISKEDMCSGDWAWLRNRLHITITPPGGKPTVRSGYTLTILKKQADGKWVLTRDANLVT